MTNTKKLKIRFFSISILYFYWAFKGHVTGDVSQRRLLGQHSVAIWNSVVTIRSNGRNNVATLCYAKNRRCKSSRVTSPYELKLNRNA